MSTVTTQTRTFAAHAPGTRNVLLLRIAIVAVVLALWEIVAVSGILFRDVVPSLVAIGAAIVKLLADPAFKEGIVRRIPIGRIGELRDLIGPAIFLCSDAASFVTGQILGIDGGLTATQ
jgi:NAD(P)-dependent dehydrogenase (short-subunit alcohol dehydrogenase family)